MANQTTLYNDLPPLPAYTLSSRPPLLPPLSDKLLTVIGPIIAYWILSLFFHWIDTKDFFPQYRLHTPAEILKRNRASRWDVLRDVFIQQIVQFVVGTLLTFTEPDDFIGKEEYDIAVWAQRIRLAQRALPTLISLVGVDAFRLSQKLGAGHSTLAAILSGGRYTSPHATKVLSSGVSVAVPAFAAWELVAAKMMYTFVVPAVQFTVAIVFLDTWQYFLHRAMHMNKYLYTTLHSRHHRLYVPYAYGALYNHPIEGLLLDTVGAGLAFKVAGMTTLQGFCFFTGSTFKTVDDHCGYALPWDPLQHITGNNAPYHDVHHQSWGIKTNFSQPFFTFWDRFLGTKWVGGDVSARYEKARLAAAKAMQSKVATNITGSTSKESAVEDPKPYENELQNATKLHSVPIEHRQPNAPSGKAELQAAGSRQQVLEDKSAGGTGVLMQESREEREAMTSSSPSPRSARKRATSSSTRESLKGLSQKVTGSTCIGGMGT